MSYKKIDPKNNDVKSIYHLMISGISPRPIALVSSIDSDGNNNLAPFSFFNGFGANPPIVGFSPALSGRTGLPKDTLLNIKETKEFSISIVTESNVNQASLSSCEFKRDVDEFVKSGFTKLKSELILPPGVAESPFIMECKLIEIIELGGKPASGNLILGEVVMFHVDKNILNIDGTIDPLKISHVGRSGGPWYTNVNKSLFKIHKPTGLGIGFDNLPSFILNSNLQGKDLAKLSGIFEVPELNSNCITNHITYDELILKIKSLLDKDNIDEAWQFILNWKKDNE